MATLGSLHVCQPVGVAQSWLHHLSIKYEIYRLITSNFRGIQIMLIGTSKIICGRVLMVAYRQNLSLDILKMAESTVEWNLTCPTPSSPLNSKIKTFSVFVSYWCIFKATLLPSQDLAKAGRGGGAPLFEGKYI